MKKHVILLLLLFLCLSLFSCKSFDETEKILSSMTLRQKAAQLLVPSFRYSSYRSENDYEYLHSLTNEIRELIEENGFGGIILFSGNLESPSRALSLINEIKEANSLNQHLPLLIGTDQEGGSVRRIPFGSALPGFMALGACDNEQDVRDYASIIASELDALGINTAFAPVADLNSNPHNPVIGIRSYGDDPDKVSSMTVPFIQTLHEHKIISCLKHFPGHGDTDTDSHSGLPCVDKSYEEISSFELLPFKAGIEAGCDMIMSAHIQYPRIETEKLNGIYLPATLSHQFLTEILRNELGFDKVIMTDSLSMDAISKYFRKKETAKYAINAGADLLLMPVDERKDVSLYCKEIESYITMICNLVKDGDISEDRIDESLRRIIRLKKERGLFDPEEEKTDFVSLRKDNSEKEMRIALHSITLLKNDGALPITEDEKVMILLPYRSQYNLLTHARALLKEKGLLEEETMPELYCFGNDQTLSDFQKNILPLFKDIGKLILVSSFYDESDLNSEQACILDLCLAEAKQRKIASILFSCQLPYDLDRYDTDAKLCCYFASGTSLPYDPAGKQETSLPPNLIAALAVAYNLASPMGKLPVSVPEPKEKDGLYSCGMNIAYPRGYSLSY